MHENQSLLAPNLIFSSEVTTSSHCNT